MIRLCIVPPYMLRSILQNGDSEQQSRAWSTLTDSEQFRGERRILTAIVPLATTPAGHKRRSIYDARGSYDLPGKLVRSEGSTKSKDPRVNEAYDGAGATYDMFKKIFSRK